jgi:hypothetical protein
MQEDLYWTDLCSSAIAQQLTDLGSPVSPPTAKKLLEENGFAKRKIIKDLAGGTTPDRNAQFEQIERLRSDYRSTNNPIFSIDTKKKELLGTLYRAGRVYSQRSFHAFDPDFPSWSLGKIVPHGIWDTERKHGHLNLGLSRDTSEFACDSFRWYWKRIGRFHYPESTSILWLCDAGGSNNCRHHIFKQDLQDLVDDIGIEIRVAHYPTYCSKFNPIERKFFSQVTRTCQGVLFDRILTVVNLMRKTKTTTGLTTTVHVIKKLYETGRKVRDNFKESVQIQFDEILPRWNYTAVPSW